MRPHFWRALRTANNIPMPDEGSGWYTRATWGRATARTAVKVSEARNAQSTANFDHGTGAVVKAP